MPGPAYVGSRVTSKGQARSRSTTSLLSASLGTRCTRTSDATARSYYSRVVATRSRVLCSSTRARGEQAVAVMLGPPSDSLVRPSHHSAARSPACPSSVHARCTHGDSASASFRRVTQTARACPWIDDLQVEAYQSLSAATVESSSTASSLSLCMSHDPSALYTLHCAVRRVTSSCLSSSLLLCSTMRSLLRTTCPCSSLVTLDRRGVTRPQQLS